MFFGNRYKKNASAAIKKTNRHPLNRRLKCDTCGAEFQETKQETELILHCNRMSGGGRSCNTWHHGYASVPPVSPKNYSKIISDNVTKWRKDFDE